MQLHSDNSSQMNIKQLAVSGMILAVALVLSYIEALIPFNFGIPGIKLGLANLCVVILLYLSNPIIAITINILRVLLSGFMFGNLSMIIYSLVGGILSFLFMYIAKRIDRFSVGGVSLIGGVTHNIGQIIVAALVVSNLNLFYYLPILLIAGSITGILIGYIAKLLIPQFNKIWS